MTTVYEGGTPYTFPDTMSADEITAEMQKLGKDPNTGQMAAPGTGQTAPQDTSMWRLPKFLGGQAAAGLAEGGGGMANLMTSMSPVGQVGKAVQDWFKPQVSPEQSAAIDKLRDLGEVAKVPLRAAGIIDRPDVQPQNAIERYVGAGVRGAAQAVPAMATGGGGMVGRAIQTLGQGLGGELGQAFSDLTAPTPGQEPSWQHQYAPAVGNVIGSLGAGLGYGAANKLAGTIAGTSTPTLDAYERLGIKPRLLAEQVGSPTAEHLTAALPHVPGAAGPFQKAGTATVNEWGQALEKTAAMLGDAATPQQLGAAAQPLANNWIKNWKATVKSNYDDVAMQVPKTHPTPPTNYRAALDETANVMPGLQGTGQALEPDLSQKLLNELVADTKIPPRNTGLLDAQGKPIMAPAMEKTPTWQDMDGLRKKIGARLAEPATYDDPANGLLKQLYGAVLDDQEAAAQAAGPKALEAFTKARASSKEGHDFIELTLSKIVKGDKIDPEAAGKNILANSGAGGSMLQRLREKLPQVADEAGAYKLREMGQGRAGTQDASETVLSPGTFLTKGSFPNLSPEATAALYGDKPWVAQNYADLRETAARMKASERLRNTSGTTPTAKWLEAGAAGTLGAGTLLSGGGLLPAAAVVAAPLAFPAIASRLLTNPGLTRLLARPSAGGYVPKTLPMIPGLL